MNKYSKIGVVVLAAGGSTRLGRPKQLVRFKSETLLEHTLNKISDQSFASKVVVLGSQASAIKKHVDEDKFEIVYNTAWENGMASSIVLGLKRSMELSKELDHLLFLVSDQPFLTKGLLDQLICVQLEDQNQATFSSYSDDYGIPAILSKSIFDKFSGLKGDQGAKKIFLDHPNFKFSTVSFPAGNFDIDTPEDLEKLQKTDNL